jgi:hypothetical protein
MPLQNGDTIKRERAFKQQTASLIWRLFYDHKGTEMKLTAAQQLVLDYIKGGSTTQEITTVQAARSLGMTTAKARATCLALVNHGLFSVQRVPGKGGSKLVFSVKKPAEKKKPQGLLRWIINLFK